MKNVKFEEDILFVRDEFDKLSIVEENEERFLKGSLDIIDGTVRYGKHFKWKLRVAKAILTFLGCTKQIMLS